MKSANCRSEEEFRFLFLSELATLSRNLGIDATLSTPRRKLPVEPGFRMVVVMISEKTGIPLDELVRGANHFEDSAQRLAWLAIQQPRQSKE